MSGLELLQRLRGLGHQPLAIMITGRSDVSMAVQAMKAGVSDFIEKPVGGSDLLASIGRALERSRDQSKTTAWREDAALARLALAAGGNDDVRPPGAVPALPRPAPLR